MRRVGFVIFSSFVISFFTVVGLLGFWVGFLIMLLLWFVCQCKMLFLINGIARKFIFYTIH